MSEVLLHTKMQCCICFMSRLMNPRFTSTVDNHLGRCGWANPSSRHALMSSCLSTPQFSDCQRPNHTSVLFVIGCLTQSTVIATVRDTGLVLDSGMQYCLAISSELTSLVVDCVVVRKCPKKLGRSQTDQERGHDHVCLLRLCIVSSADILRGSQYAYLATMTTTG